MIPMYNMNASPMSTSAADAAVFAAAYEAWCGGSALRQSRARYKDFTYGRQWGDKVETPSGHIMTEGEYSRICGRTPQTNNIIRQLVKTIVGRFRAMVREDAGQRTLSGMVSRQEMSEIRRSNALDEIDARMLEEFLISGCAIQRVTVEKRMAGEGVWVDNVSPASFFINRFTDPRGLDIELVGMLHSLSFREVMMRFGTDCRRAEEIRRAYGRSDVDEPAIPGVSLGDDVAADFFHAPGRRCRVIEVWTLESRNVIRCHDPEQGSVFLVSADKVKAIEGINAARSASSRPTVKAEPRVTMRWHCRMFTPEAMCSMNTIRHIRTDCIRLP